MNIICKRLKAFSSLTARKTVGSRNLAGKLINTKTTEWNVLNSFGITITCIRVRPLNINYNIFPAKLFKIFCHVFGICTNLIFVYHCVVIVVTVPAHWWHWCCCVFIIVFHIYFFYLCGGFDTIGALAPYYSNHRTLPVVE